MPTFEQVREKIRKHFPKDHAGSDAKRQKLQWDHETARTMIDATGTYRITKKMDEELNVTGYWVELCATSTSAPRSLSGPYLMPRDARDAAQAHKDGLPLQADLA
jgi:hypothetical protein